MLVLSRKVGQSLVIADGVTVTQVAERWGFHHLGSFAVEYRKRWGEAPSETLRR